MSSMFKKSCETQHTMMNLYQTLENEFVKVNQV